MIIDPQFYAIADVVVKDIKGRAADAGRSLPALGKVVSLAGPGDHIEIGTLFGASAIMAALVKQEMGHTGQIFCVDPFLPRDVKYDKNDPKVLANKEATLDDVLENFEKFKVSDRMVVVPQTSQPWPVDLENHEFVSGYIDGNHQAGMPWLDFLSLRDRVRAFIAFDNFEEAYPDIVVAGLRALSSGGWFLHYKEGTFLNMRRPFIVKDFEKEWQKLREASAM
jgi:hypothetical protein